MNIQPITLKIARFKRIGDSYSYETVAGEELEDSDSFVRISEYVEITFQPMQNDEQIQAHVKVLDKLRETTVIKFSKSLAEIDSQKAELLALTYQSEQ
jgi:hypothetical protein